MHYFGKRGAERLAMAIILRVMGWLMKTKPEILGRGECAALRDPSCRAGP